MKSVAIILVEDLVESVEDYPFPEFELSGTLLSIFPVDSSTAFVRMSCIALDIGFPAPRPPVLSPRDEFVSLLSDTSLRRLAEQIVLQIEDWSTVQMLITDEDARVLGFYPRTA